MKQKQLEKVIGKFMKGYRSIREASGKYFSWTDAKLDEVSFIVI